MRGENLHPPVLPLTDAPTVDAVHRVLAKVFVDLCIPLHPHVENGTVQNLVLQLIQFTPCGDQVTITEPGKVSRDEVAKGVSVS